MFEAEDMFSKLSAALNSYEVTAQDYLFGINSQRKLQIFLIRRILAKHAIGEASYEQACAMLYALLQPMPEQTRHLGFGSQLKTILHNFMSGLNLEKSTVYAKPHERLSAQPLAKMSEGKITKAARAFFAELAKLKCAESSANKYAITTELYQDMLRASQEVALKYQNENYKLSDIATLGESVNDLFSNVQTMPLQLMQDIKQLYHLLNEQEAEKEPNALLNRLPVDLRGEFAQYISGDPDFLSDDDLTQAFLSNRDFAENFIDAKFSPVKTKEINLIDEVAKLRLLRTKVDHILQCGFILAAQLNPTERVLYLANRKIISIESLMNYVVALPAAIDSKLPPGLLARRQSIIDRYVAIRKTGIPAANKISTLLEHYYPDDLASADFFILLQKFDQEPKTAKKQTLMKTLTTIDPMTLTSLLQDLSKSISKTPALRSEAVTLVADVLQIAADAEAKSRQESLITLALQSKIIRNLREYIEDLVMQRAANLVKKKADDIKKGKMVLHSSQDPRLESEIAAVREAIFEVIPLLDEKLNGIAEIKFKLADCLIVKPVAGAARLTASFEPSGLKITPKVKLAQLPELPAGTSAKIMQHILQHGVIVQGQEVINSSGHLMPVELPLVQHYKATCNKSIRTASGNVITDKIATKMAMQELILAAANNYYECMGGADKHAYALKQTMLKFKKISSVSFNEGKIDINIDFALNRETPDQYLKRIKGILDQSNRLFLNMWYSSDTSSFINSRIKNASGLRMKTNVLLYKLVNGKLVATPAEKEHDFVRQLSKVLGNTNEISLAKAHRSETGDPEELDAEDPTKKPSSTPFCDNTCSKGSCLCAPVFPMETLTERAARAG
jgi:hypothetical protein